MKINRIWEMPNKYTFQIQSIKSLLQKYNIGNGWIDPFSGKTSPAEITNDLNPDMPATYHLRADEFIKQLTGKYQGILFDPPYSAGQTKECYQSIGIEFSQNDSQQCVHWGNIKNIAKDLIIESGYAISFGWNSCGFGINRGFEIIEILLVCHGRAHNDTICTVEQKINQGALF